MRLFIFEAIVDGFGPFEFNFATRLSQDPVQSDVFIAQIIDNIVDVLRSPDAGAALSVAGHADRDDTAGRSHIDRLAVEGNNPTTRSKKSCLTCERRSSSVRIRPQDS
jgi:hypothetical protein